MEDLQLENGNSVHFPLSVEVVQNVAGETGVRIRPWKSLETEFFVQLHHDVFVFTDSGLKSFTEIVWLGHSLRRLNWTGLNCDGYFTIPWGRCLLVNYLHSQSPLTRQARLLG